MRCCEPPTPEWLLGMSAGEVCRVLDDPTGSPIEAVVEAAYEVAYEQGLYLSSWVYSGVSGDGGTVWRSPENDAVAEVTPGLEITLRPA